LRKGCVKNCVKKQIVENQALREILYAFTHMRKDISQTRPTHLPTDQSVSWHDFCTQEPDFFYTFTLNRNMRNKMRKILENQGFGLLRKALRMLYACFTQTCTFAKNIR
jgi:DNA-binding transcriptional regulator PaaX